MRVLQQPQVPSKPGAEYIHTNLLIAAGKEDFRFDMPPMGQQEKELATAKDPERSLRDLPEQLGDAFMNASIAYACWKKHSKLNAQDIHVIQSGTTRNSLFSFNLQRMGVSSVGASTKDLGDTFECSLGLCYLEGGWNKAHGYTDKSWMPLIEEAVRLRTNGQAATLDSDVSQPEGDMPDNDTPTPDIAGSSSSIAISSPGNQDSGANFPFGFVSRLGPQGEADKENIAKTSSADQSARSTTGRPSEPLKRVFGFGNHVAPAQGSSTTQPSLASGLRKRKLGHE